MVIYYLAAILKLLNVFLCYEVMTWIWLYENQVFDNVPHGSAGRHVARFQLEFATGELDESQNIKVQEESTFSPIALLAASFTSLFLKL